MEEMLIEERYNLAAERIREMREERLLPDCYADYFSGTAAFAGLLTQEYAFVESGNLLGASLDRLQQHNRALYEDILPEHYDASYANPAYAKAQLGERYGQLLSFVYTELRSSIADVYEQYREGLVIRLELLLEIYGSFRCAFEETKALPEYEELRQIVYWFMSDYSEILMERRNEEQLNPDCDFALRIIMDRDLSDVRYLYAFGEYITENELRTAKYLGGLGDETLQLMADTYTEGYRIGFEVGNKDITGKQVVNIRYSLGFEAMIKKAVVNFEKMGLRPTIYRASPSAFFRRGMQRVGYFGASANKQYEYDHKEDEAIYLDKQLVNRRLEILRGAFEKNKAMAAVHGGPAVVEVFGEKPFSPKSKPEALRLDEVQQRLSLEYASASGELTNRYIKGEERSFTIIAFPVSDIGPQYEEIFQEVIKINTLDYILYRDIQANMIETLNQGVYVEIKGANGNETDMKVALWERCDPEREDLFENCVADVNIPVGEVFTTPRLKGTAGLLHVKRVFLGELEYRDLRILFEDGWTKEYSCANFDSREEGRRYIRDNVMSRHERLPLGEFAIGTNTTAYMAARKYDIADKLPILIAEKMGPHFAVGDTCYSHAEEVRVYNPGGREIIAKDNEVSRLRREDSSKAYFNCHTDITIPYDELGEVTVVTGEGERLPVILNGRFVLPGCEELNRPFEQKEKSTVFLEK